jgi:hypothetical protein
MKDLREPVEALGYFVARAFDGSSRAITRFDDFDQI